MPVTNASSYGRWKNRMTGRRPWCVMSSIQVPGPGGSNVIVVDGSVAVMVWSPAGS